MLVISNQVATQSVGACSTGCSSVGEQAMIPWPQDGRGESNSAGPGWITNERGRTLQQSSANCRSLISEKRGSDRITMEGFDYWADRRREEWKADKVPYAVREHRSLFGHGKLGMASRQLAPIRQAPTGLSLAHMSRRLR
jgi:hypothetical protein